MLVAPAVSKLYAVHPLGQTAGLKSKRLSEATLAGHPGGWHVVKRGSAASDTVIWILYTVGTGVPIPSLLSEKWYLMRVADTAVVVKMSEQVAGLMNAVGRAGSAMLEYWCQ